MFELSSKIIDFKVIESEDCEPDSLLVLSEEEIVVVDLVTEGWPEYPLPYLLSLHASAVTCLSLQSSVSPELVARLSTREPRDNLSGRAWPVRGGECEQLSPDSPSIILTGLSDTCWGIH